MVKYLSITVVDALFIPNLSPPPSHFSKSHFPASSLPVVPLRLPSSLALSSHPPPPPQEGKKDEKKTATMSRRKILKIGTSITISAVGSCSSISSTSAMVTPPSLIPKPTNSNINSSTDTSNIIETKTVTTNYDDDPPPLLFLPFKKSKSSSISIPRIGYSFYKTKPERDEIERCTRLALRAGIHYFDVATLYGSNVYIGNIMKCYLDTGETTTTTTSTATVDGVTGMMEHPELLSMLDQVNQRGNEHAIEIAKQQRRRRANLSKGGGVDSKSTRNAERRSELFISHKLSNKEQQASSSISASSSTSSGNDDATKTIEQSIRNTIQELQCNYLDMVSIHSPCTNADKRLTTYRSLLKIQERYPQLIRSIGVCNYGIQHLNEIYQANLPLPSMNQLELSPFNQHSSIVKWCQQHDVKIGCAAWSKLSSSSGPTEQWDILSKVASTKQMTKSQVLIRWSLQKGYVCVPRSGGGDKLSRLAIGENTYGGVNYINSSSPLSTSSQESSSSTNQKHKFVLNEEEMKILDGLDVGLKTGRLGRLDGWDISDVTGVDWDSTDYV